MLVETDPMEDPRLFKSLNCIKKKLIIKSSGHWSSQRNQTNCWLDPILAGFYDSKENSKFMRWQEDWRNRLQSLVGIDLVNVTKQSVD